MSHTPLSLTTVERRRPAPFHPEIAEAPSNPGTSPILPNVNELSAAGASRHALHALRTSIPSGPRVGDGEPIPVSRGDVAASIANGEDRSSIAYEARSRPRTSWRLQQPTAASSGFNRL